MKYTKRPIVVEAIQFTDNESFGKMLNEWGPSFEEIAEFKELGFISLRDGQFSTVRRFDYVVKSDGRFYSCTQDAFEKQFCKWST